MCHKNPSSGVYLTRTSISVFTSTVSEEAISMKSSSTIVRFLGTTRFRFVLLLASLSLGWACYHVSEVSYSYPQNTSAANQWLIEMRTGENKVQLTMRWTRQNDKGGFGSSNWGFGVPFEQLVGLTREQVMSSGSHVEFQMKRDAGTFSFDGWFKEGNGSGHFTFNPNASFAGDLDRQGFGKPNDEQLFSLAMSDIGFTFINELKAQGYDTPSLDQLVKMGEHGVRLEYVQGLKALGYSVKSTDLLVKMKDHGVNLNFIQEMTALGYANLTPEELIRTRDHGVNAAYINEFIAAGYSRSSLDGWITLRDHGVNTNFIQGLKALGYERLPLDELRSMKDHGVNPSFIQELKDAGYDRVPVDQLIRLRDHGVSASYIRKMKERGYGDLSLDEYIRLRDRGERDE